MGKPPRSDIDEDIGPLRAAGITPGPAMAARRDGHLAE
jgi:hypothetical protein